MPPGEGSVPGRAIASSRLLGYNDRARSSLWERREERRIGVATPRAAPPGAGRPAGTTRSPATAACGSVCFRRSGLGPSRRAADAGDRTFAGQVRGGQSRERARGPRHRATRTVAPCTSALGSHRAGDRLRSLGGPCRCPALLHVAQGTRSAGNPSCRRRRSARRAESALGGRGDRAPGRPGGFGHPGKRCPRTR